MTDKDKKAYMKAWRQAHRDELKAYKKAWRQAHREELKAQMKAYYQANREERKSYNRAHRDEKKAYMKAWRQAHGEDIKDYNKAWQQAHKEEIKAYKKSDTNSLGKTKQSVRERSNRYLFNVLKHTKMDGYEIHHCFGYDDYRNFIYIPKSLHLKIHQYLRDNCIDADTDHYNKIVHLIIACEEYVYIKA